MAALAVVAVAAPGKVAACEWVDVAVAVHHWNGKEYDEDGPLIGCAYGAAHVRYFKNSHGWDSWAVTGAVPLHRRVALELGAVKGYRHKLPQMVGEWSPWVTLRVQILERHSHRIDCHFLAAEAVACTFSLRGWSQ